MLIFICLCSWSLTGVFGEGVKSVSVMEGDSVTLNFNDADLMGNELIMLTFGHNNSLIATTRNDNEIQLIDERFRSRLKLDQTGSLIITNTRTTDSGLYQALGTSKDTPLSTFSITVYACLPVPVISSNTSQNVSSSGSLLSSCVFLCSVVNVGDVTLSWYKGNSLFSRISVSDPNRSLSLHLECLDDFYSCVVNNPIRNQTTHLNNTELCQPCSDSVFPIVLISAAAASGFLLIVTTVWIFCICRKHRKTDQEVQTGDREITYADPTFYKRHKSRATEKDNVVYAGVSRR